MKKLRRLWGRGKLRASIIMAIALLCVYFLIRLITLSFSDNIGQAKRNFTNLLMSKLCINVMESGSSFISYLGEKETKYSFPMNLLADQYVLHEFTKENNSQALKTFLQEGHLSDTLKEEETKKSNRIGFRDITEGILTKEYILTNGAALDRTGFNNKMLADLSPKGSGDGQLPVGILDGDLYFEESEDKNSVGEGSSVDTMTNNSGVKFTMEQLKDVSFLIRNFYIVDPETKVTENLFNAEELLEKDVTLKQENDAPQILIYHTHSKEAYVDSRENVKEDTVVGIGTYLEEILEEAYGYNVIHDKSTYDNEGRSIAYDYAEVGIQKILNENPSIEVVIDLHRDAYAKRSTMINGKETAQIMLFNGLCRDQEGPLTRLDNPYLKDNLAFSLQLQLKSLELYPGLFYKNYLNAYRYNMHVRQKCILMELGTDENSLVSARNAMPPFAKILDAVLQGEGENPEQEEDDDSNPEESVNQGQVEVESSNQEDGEN